ncbi:hypothetical protein MHBO_002257 [Bonamia ostreae]|uniref:Uncharacterized protein n=1 Tax=Bonamia ostreae TaxID=126728 RepID=A0ABV2ALR7_9EUKA
MAFSLTNFGLISLAFSLLNNFEQNLFPLFSVLTKKCLSIQNSSFLSYENNSVLSIEERLILQFDIGTEFSRCSWLLLESLLAKYDRDDQKYAKFILQILLSKHNKNSFNHRENFDKNGENNKKQNFGKNGLKISRIFGKIKFVPKFLEQMLLNLKGKKGKSFSEVYCFSYGSNAIFFLRVLVEEGYLSQAAEMAIRYCRNERLRYLKENKEIWYPRNLLKRLRNSMSEFIQQHLKKRKPANFWLIRNLFVNLKTEIALCDSLDNALFDDV